MFPNKVLLLTAEHIVLLTVALIAQFDIAFLTHCMLSSILIQVLLCLMEGNPKAYSFVCDECHVHGTHHKRMNTPLDCLFAGFVVVA